MTLFGNIGGVLSGGKTSTCASFAGGSSLIFGGVSTTILNIALDCTCLQESPTVGRASPGAHFDTTSTERETSRLAARSVARQASDFRAAGVCLSVLRAEDVPRSVFRQLQ